MRGADEMEADKLAATLAVVLISAAENALLFPEGNRRKSSSLGKARIAKIYADLTRIATVTPHLLCTACFGWSLSRRAVQYIVMGIACKSGLLMKQMVAAARKTKRTRIIKTRRRTKGTRRARKAGRTKGIERKRARRRRSKRRGGLLLSTVLGPETP